ncbi:MAG: DUF3052 family protein [Verrucomicrobia bacterium]|nr:DUF3052 family protein [Verrucomicrobiota bacterium]
MAGYSGTPLPKKLGIKYGYKIALPGIPADVRAALREAIAGCTLEKDGCRVALDFVLLFARASIELKEQFPFWAGKLAPAGMLWIAWPKKSSGVPSDLDDNKVRTIGLNAGLVDVKVCAVTDIWSGLKFVIRVKDRPKSG